MNKKQKIVVVNVIENEGFDYTFCHYDDFEHVKDHKFHELRLNYIKATEELKNYIDYDNLINEM